MVNSDGKRLFALNFFAAALCLGGAMAACTPATDNPVPLANGGGNGSESAGAAGGSSSGSSTTSGSSSGSSAPATGSGGPSASSSGTTNGASSGAAAATLDGGSSGAASGSSAASSSSGAATGGPGATGGLDAGASPDGPSPVAADGAVAVVADDGGCNWVQNADGTWAFDPSAPNKIVLFDGTQATFDMWHKENQPGVPIQWTLNADGTMTVVPSGTGQATEVQSDQGFENLCVHVEYLTPYYPSVAAGGPSGQKRGNSGVYLKSAYEMQILDSLGDPPANDTCGAAYSIAAPLVVACNMAEVWNTYEIEFKSSVWNTAVTPPVKTGNAEFLKCALNGQIVQLDTVLNPAAGYTPAGIPDAPGPQPLGLQDHLDLVSFRNVWVRVPQY
jgi:hypothetical protein